MSPIIVALIAGLAPTVAIVANYYLTRRDNNKAAARVATKVETVAEKVADTADHSAVKLDEIHVLVNSRLSEALQRIDELERSLHIGPNDPPPIPRP